MRKGFVKVYRKILDSGIINNPDVAQLFLYLMVKASSRDRTQLVGTTPVRLRAGDTVIGRNRLAEEFGTSPQRVRTALEALTALGVINQQTTNKYTVVSFVNWSTYQNNHKEKQPANNQQTTSKLTNKEPAEQPAVNQRLTTIKEVKNIRNNNTPLTPLLQGESEEPKAGKQEKAKDNCPYHELVDIYHEALPELPRVMKISKAREGRLNARWEEIMQRLKELGKDQSKEEGLAWWRRFLMQCVRPSPLLMGLVKRRDGPTWQANFDWLTRPENFLKTLEQNYLERATA